MKAPPKLCRAWRYLRLRALALKPIRVPIVVVLAMLAFVLSGQGQDVVRALAEQFDATGRSGEQGSWARVWFFAGALAWSLSAWYWSRSLLLLRLPGVPGDLKRLRALRIWAPRVLGSLAALGLSAAFFRASLGYAAGEDDDVKQLLLGDALWCLLGAIVFLAAAWQRRRIFAMAFAWLNRWTVLRTGVAARIVGTLDLPPIRQQAFNALTAKQLEKGTRALLHVTLWAAVLLFILFALWVQETAPFFGSAAIMLFAACGWIAFGSRIDVAGMRRGFPVFTSLFALAVLFSFWNDNHEVRTLTQPGASQDTRPRLHEALEDWRKRQVPGARGEIPMFLVNAEGGGIRAAWWTARVLGEIQDRHPGFADQLFSLSGVSGGSLGAAAFVALLEEQGGPPGTQRCGPKAVAAPPDHFKNGARALLGRDFLSPVVAAILYPDLFQRFFPVAVPAFDRARALEGAWEGSWRALFPKSRRFEADFADLWKGGARWTPALFLNATWVETGKRLIASNVRIESGDRKTEDFVDAEDSVRFLLPGRLPLSAAAHMSARFTYVSPAGTLVREGRTQGHVVDGGYFENSGATTTLEILMSVDALSDKDPRWKPVRPIVIHITNEPVDPALGPDTLERARDNPAIAPPGGLGEVMSPLRALLNARGARGVHARETMDWRLASDFLRFGLCQHRDKAPLGWVLSSHTRSRMEGELSAMDPACAAAVASGRRIADNAANLEMLAAVTRPCPASGLPPSQPRRSE
jgi:hypothetical protein